MLGELPQDFLRVQFAQVQTYDPAVYGARQNYQQMTAQQIQQNPNFLGYFTLTIVEVNSLRDEFFFEDKFLILPRRD